MVLKARLDLMDHQGKGLTVQTPRSERPTTAWGSKSPAVKFGKILCSQCNGIKSQKWDKAYLEFVRYGVSNPNFLRNKQTFSWSKNYPSLRVNGPALTRYYAKQIGCRLINRDKKVPSPIRNFLLDCSTPPPFSLFLVEDYEWLDVIELASGRFDYPIIKFNYEVPEAPDQPPSNVMGLFHEGPYGVIFYFDSEQSPINNFATQPSSPIYSRKNFPDFMDRLWKTHDNYRATVEKFLHEDRIQELYDSADFLNIWKTHD